MCSLYQICSGLAAMSPILIVIFFSNLTLELFFTTVVSRTKLRCQDPFTRRDFRGAFFLFASRLLFAIQSSASCQLVLLTASAIKLLSKTFFGQHISSRPELFFFFLSTCACCKYQFSVLSSLTCVKIKHSDGETSNTIRARELSFCSNLIRESQFGSNTILHCSRHYTPEISSLSLSLEASSSNTNTDFRFQQFVRLNRA